MHSGPSLSENNIQLRDIQPIIASHDSKQVLTGVRTSAVSSMSHDRSIILVKYVPISTTSVPTAGSCDAKPAVADGGVSGHCAYIRESKSQGSKYIVEVPERLLFWIHTFMSMPRIGIVGRARDHAESCFSTDAIIHLK